MGGVELSAVVGRNLRELKLLTPIPGAYGWVEDENRLYIGNGADWVLVAGQVFCRLDEGALDLTDIREKG